MAHGNNTHAHMHLFHDFLLALPKIFTLTEYGWQYFVKSQKKLPAILLNAIALRKAKIVYNFGLSECNRVNLDSLDITDQGPGCSKLMTSLVNVLLKFQMLISQIHKYFLLKKCEKLLHCKSFSHFFNKKYQCIWL